MAQAPADLVDGEHPVNHGGGGPHRDQGVHIGRAAEEGLEAHLIIFVVEVHDGQGQQQLGEGKGQGVFHPHQESRQGRAHHVSHGDVEQGQQEGEGPDHPVLHLLQLPGGGVLRTGRGLPLPLPLRQGGPVAGALYGIDDALRRDGIFVIGHLHTARQQVHADGGDALHFAHRLLHVGGAGGAGHARHLKGLFHSRFLPSISSACSARPAARQPPAHPPGGCRPPRRCGGVPPAAPC